MNDIECRLHAHLAARAQEVTPADMLPQIMSGTTVVPLSSKAPDRRWRAVATVAAAVLMVGAGVAIIGSGDPRIKPSDQPPAPLPSGVPQTGVEWTPAGQLRLEAASRILQQECMHRAGFDYEADVETLAEAMGAWEPHAVLGIGTEAAAARYGYRMATPPSGADQAAATLPSADRERFLAAFTGGPDTPSTDVTLPDGTPSGTGPSWGGCMGEVDDAFGGLLSTQEGLRVYIEDRGTDSAALADKAASDGRVTTALAQWRSCVTRVAGESALADAQTPNELARIYALSGVETTNDEIQLAITDSRCQAEADLQATWYRVYAEYQRAALTEHQEWFDLLATMRSQIIARAGEILDERGLDTTGSPE